VKDACSPDQGHDEADDQERQEHSERFRRRALAADVIDDRDFRIQWEATAKPSHTHPAAKAFDGFILERVGFQRRLSLNELFVHLPRLIPRIAAVRLDILPISLFSGETRSHFPEGLPTRPLQSMCPLIDSAFRLKILSRMILPAPFLPIMPNTQNIDRNVSRNPMLLKFLLQESIPYYRAFATISPISSSGPCCRVAT